MKAEIIRKVIESGKTPLMRLTGCPWEEGFGEKGMIARITKITTFHDMFKYTFDYNEHREHNLKLASHDFYIGSGIRKQGTAIEAGLIEENDLQETVYFEDKDNMPIEWVEDNPILKNWVETSTDIPYVEWLEAIVKNM